MANSRKKKSRGGVEEFLLDLDIQTLDEGGFVATSRQIQGLVAQGRTIAETVEIARDVARKIIESCIEHGDPVPSLGVSSKRRITTKVPVSISR